MKVNLLDSAGQQMSRARRICPAGEARLLIVVIAVRHRVPAMLEEWTRRVLVDARKRTLNIVAFSVERF